MGIYMKRQILKKIFFAFVILTLGSCKDPAVFYTIAHEEKKLEPLIKGSPTNFVVFKGNMYIGSGATLYMYNGQYPDNPARGRWTSATLNGNIRQLAVTSTTMYALCGDSGENVLKKSDNGSSWSDVSVPDGIDVQSIHAVNDQLFIGAGKYGSYSILNGNNFTVLTDTSYRLLNGAAFDGKSYYLTANDIDKARGSTYKITIGGTTDTINNDIQFMGIINLGNTIVAISRKGELYYVTSNISYTGYRLSGLSDGKEKNKLATGALAIWTDPNTSGRLLLVGRQDEMLYTVNYLHGYQELELEAGGIKSGAVFREPGLYSLSSVENNATYKSNMEKNPVNYIYQASDGVLFASTQKNGVWSYRLRESKWLWNSEQ